MVKVKAKLGYGATTVDDWARLFRGTSDVGSRVTHHDLARVFGGTSKGIQKQPKAIFYTPDEVDA